MSLSPQARANAQRILDAEARRLLEERNLRGVVKHTWGFPPCGAGYGVSA
jgi:hypothetical protein